MGDAVGRSSSSSLQSFQNGDVCAVRSRASNRHGANASKRIGRSHSGKREIPIAPE